MFKEILIFGQSTTLPELIAMITGLLGVWLTMKESIWCFPAGIINVSLYAWLFLSPDIRLYADALLQILYIILLIYGWIKWNSITTRDKTTYKINLNTGLKAGMVCIASTIILAMLLENYTNASYPWLDSSLTCLSLCAQWMIAKKFIENWILWVIVDVAYLPLYISKNLTLTAILYGVFLILAFKGFREWKKNLATG